MKRIAAAALALLVLIVGGIFYIPSMLDWESYKIQGATAIKKATGYNVLIEGPLSLSILPAPSLDIGALSAMPPETDDAVLSLEGASVRVQLIPLFSGRIVVDKIVLERPRIHLLVLADGRQSWMTPELEALAAGKAAAREATPAGDAASPAQEAAGVAFNAIEIRDGAFQYKNLLERNEKSLSGIDATLHAESLAGPYAAKGSIVFEDKKIPFEIKAGSRTDGALPLEVSAGVPDAELEAGFSGALGIEGGFSAQGSITLALANPAAAIEAFSGSKPAAPALSHPFDLKGMLTASAESAEIADLALSLGSTRFSGKAGLSGLKSGAPEISASLDAGGTIEIEDFLPPPGDETGESSGTKGRSAGAGGFLPTDFALPAFLPSGKIRLAAPDVKWKGESLRNVSLVFSRQGEGASAVFEIGEMPGKAHASGQARFPAGKGKTPALEVSLKAGSQYLADTLDFLIGEDKARPDLFRTAQTDLSILISPDKVEVGSARVTLDETILTGTLSYALPKDPDQGFLDLDLSAGVLDLDTLSAKFAQQGPPQQPPPEPENKTVGERLSVLKGFSLPFDASFDLRVDKALYQGKTISGAHLAGRLENSTLTLDSLGAQDYLGARVAANGKIADIRNLGGVDIKIEGGARDVEELLVGLGLDASALPRPFGAADVKATFRGDADALHFAADASAIRGSAQISGTLTGLPDALGADALDLSLKHPSFADVMRTLRPGLPRDPALTGPLEAKARILREGQTYKIAGLSATLGGTSVAGDVAIDLSATRPAVSGKIRTGTVPLDAWIGAGGSAPAAPQSQPQQGARDSRWSRNAIDTGWMRALDLDLAIESSGLRYKGWLLDKPAFSATLKDGVLTVPPFESGLFNGRVSLGGKMASDTDPRKPLSVEGTAKADGVALAPMVRAFTGALPLDADGNVSMTLDARASGVSMAALIFDLSGNGTLDGRNVTLNGVDLARFGAALSSETKPGETLKGLWGGATRGGSTRFDTVEGSYKIVEGVVRIEKLAFDGPQARIDTTGAISLPQWSVDLKNTITLRQPAKGGDAPPPPFDIAISGPLDNPGQTFGQGLLEDYFQRKLNRKLEGVIQDKLGKKLPPALQGLLGPQSGAGSPATPPPAAAPAPTPEAAQPAAGEEDAPQAAPPPEQQQVNPEDVFRDLLNNIGR